MVIQKVQSINAKGVMVKSTQQKKANTTPNTAVHVSTQSFLNGSM